MIIIIIFFLNIQSQLIKSAQISRQLYITRALLVRVLSRIISHQRRRQPRIIRHLLSGVVRHWLLSHEQVLGELLTLHTAAVARDNSKARVQ